jgi:hypothetical protein
MTAATLARVDRRARDLITVPRAALEESFLDVQALTFEARRELAKAYVAEKRGADPLPYLYAADRRLIRLHDRARQRAAEAAGITFISPGQTELPLLDGCVDDHSTA